MLLGKVYFLRKWKEGHKKKATLLVKHKIKKEKRKKKLMLEKLQPSCKHEEKPKRSLTYEPLNQSWNCLFLDLL